MSGPTGWPAVKCDGARGRACHQDATEHGTCPTCGKEYHRCRMHDGAAGVRRSLHSHTALYHPKEASQ